VFGDTEVTTGASSDLQAVTSMARTMVTQYGMSTVGPIALESQQRQPFMGGGRNPGADFSDETAYKIDQQIKEIVTHCHKQAVQMISENRIAVDRIVDVLLEKETVSGQEFKELLSEYREVPSKYSYTPKIS